MRVGNVSREEMAEVYKLETTVQEWEKIEAAIVNCIEASNIPEGRLVLMQLG